MPDHTFRNLLMGARARPRSWWHDEWSFQLLELIDGFMEPDRMEVQKKRVRSPGQAGISSSKSQSSLVMMYFFPSYMFSLQEGSKKIKVIISFLFMV